ncbi:MAG: hypothetical protein HC877_17460 [Thioploca sp.]|nr:hypothetical protein [Thioploca sp.]
MKKNLLIMLILSVVTLVGMLSTYVVFADEAKKQAKKVERLEPKATKDERYHYHKRLHPYKQTPHDQRPRRDEQPRYDERSVDRT